MQILSNKLLSQLQYKYSQNTTQGQKLSKSDLENNVQIASINYNEAKLTYEDIKDKAEKLKKKLDSYDAAFNSTTWHNQQNKWDSKSTNTLSDIS